MTHPVLVEVTRGGMVESRHNGSYAVVDGKGRVVASAGDIEVPFSRARQSRRYNACR